MAENPWLSEGRHPYRLDVSTYPVSIEDAACALSLTEYESDDARWLRVNAGGALVDVPTFEISLGLGPTTGAVVVPVFHVTVAVRRNNVRPEVVAGQTEVPAADGACEDENDFGCLRLESCRGRPCYLYEFPDFAVTLDRSCACPP